MHFFSRCSSPLGTHLHNENILIAVFRVAHLHNSHLHQLTAPVAAENRQRIPCTAHLHTTLVDLIE